MAWLRPQNLDEALSWLEQYRPKIVCGGTDLFVNWQRRRQDAAAENWLDIQGIPELKRIARTSEGLELGAAVTAAEIWQNESLGCVAALQQAARIVGGWQIQNRASIGGNIANASPAADMVVPLFAYKAVVRVAGPGGTRSVPIAEFVLGPRKTALQPGELIASVFIPAASLDAPQLFLRHDQRGATDISIISVALVLEGTRERVEWGSAAVGAASPAAFTLPELEDSWKGPMDPAKLERMAAAYADRSRPITDVRASADYRKALVKVYIQRAARTLLGVD